MAEMPIVDLSSSLRAVVDVGIPTTIRPAEGEDHWIVLGPNKTTPDCPPSHAVIQVRRIGWVTKNGVVYGGIEPPENTVPIFVPLEKQ
jgi:hypothetical protein